MPFVTSADGTRIAYETRGRGPTLLLVDGAMCARNMGPMPALADALSDRFTVWLFDRRGRGESGDGPGWSPEKEIADIGALLAAMGEAPMMFGISSGALLAARAAAAHPGVKKLALYEAPMIVDDTHAPMPADFVARIGADVKAGRHDAAVKRFMAYVGVPGIMLWIMPLLPMWKKITVNAATLPYDLALVAPLQTGRPLVAADWAGVNMPTLVMDGGKSPTYMRNAQRAWAAVLPDARHRTLAGQTHNVGTGALAPVLAEFLA